jgi:hypothetical protein
VDLGEPALGNRDWEGFDVDVPVDFGLLALCAVLGPGGDVLLIPDQINLEHKSRFVASVPGWAMLWMRLNGAAVSEQHEQSPHSCGCVAGQSVSANRLKRNC